MMSDTIVDMAKITQMLDAGWSVEIAKNECGTYFVQADHKNEEMKARVVQTLLDSIEEVHFHDAARHSAFETDDFTPEQALTRIAYKVMGEII